MIFVLIQVFPDVVSINQNTVEFKDGKRRCFDAIVLATGYKSVAHKWLKVIVYFILNIKPRAKILYIDQYLFTNLV